jgi:hypothetical protein
MQEMKIINNGHMRLTEQDWLELSSLLVKAGYRVTTKKERLTPTSKNSKVVLVAEEVNLG